MKRIKDVFQKNKNFKCVVITHNKEEFEYRLPTISYGITNENDKKECYVYSILNPKEKKDMSDEEIRFNKKINRLLYKVNGGVKEAEELDNGLFSYENISDVSPSAVVSLLVFLMLLKEKGITKIKAVPYLPLRYLSRDMMAKEKTGERRDELLERNLMIQKNVTDKFIRTFFRAAYHLDDSEVVLMPYEMDECLHFRIGSNMKTDNVLLNEAVESTKGR